jgi:hypothetical protein
VDYHPDRKLLYCSGLLGWGPLVTRGLSVVLADVSPPLDSSGLLSFYFNSSSIKMAPPSRNPFSLSKTGKSTNPPPKRPLKPGEDAFDRDYGAMFAAGALTHRFYITRHDAGLTYKHELVPFLDDPHRVLRPHKVSGELDTDRKWVEGSAAFRGKCVEAVEAIGEVESILDKDHMDRLTSTRELLTSVYPELTAKLVRVETKVTDTIQRLYQEKTQLEANMQAERADWMTEKDNWRTERANWMTERSQHEKTISNEKIEISRLRRTLIKAQKKWNADTSELEKRLESERDTWTVEKSRFEETLRRERGTWTAERAQLEETLRRDGEAWMAEKSQLKETLRRDGEAWTNENSRLHRTIDKVRAELNYLQLTHSQCRATAYVSRYGSNRPSGVLNPVGPAFQLAGGQSSQQSETSTSLGLDRGQQVGQSSQQLGIPIASVGLGREQQPSRYSRQSEILTALLEPVRGQQPGLFQSPGTSTCLDSPPAPVQVPYQFLVSGTLEAGPRVNRASQAVINQMANQITRWDGQAKGTHWSKKGNISHRRCVETRRSGLKRDENAPASEDPNVACRRCVDHGIVCVLIDKNGRSVVVPVPEGDRSPNATPTSGDYYMKTSLGQVRFLASGFIADGRRITDVDASMFPMVEAQIVGWEASGFFKRGWAYVSPAGGERCCETRRRNLNRNKGPVPSDPHGNVACKNCIEKGLLCMLIDGKGPVVVPLPPWLRDGSVSEKEKAYYYIEGGRLLY